MLHNALTDIKCRGARPVGRPYKLADGRGLYLLVMPTGGKWWRFKYRFGGVLELIPSEIERLIMPLPAKAVIDLVNLDADVRTLQTHEVLARQNKIVLGALGVPQAKQDCILAAWNRLRARRQRASGELSAAAER